MALGTVLTLAAASSGLVCGLLVAAGWKTRARVESSADWAEPPRGRLSLAQVPFANEWLELRPVVEAVMAEARPRARRNGTRLKHAIASNLGVRGDRRIVHEIVSDLVEHAVDAAPHGRVLLTAASRGGRVQLTVSDDGSGGSEEQRRAALATTSELLALLGGTMHVDASGGVGTTVIVRLPEPGPREDTAGAEGGARGAHATQLG